MTAEQRRGSDRLRWLGICAADHLYDLTDVSPRMWTSARWLRSDTRSLNTWYNVEEAALDVPVAAPGRRLRDYIAAGLDHYHTALPFTEGERLWLRGIYRQHREGNEIGTHVAAIKRQRGEIRSAGLRDVVHGGELLYRWWQWRRDADDFEGHGATTAARDALAHLALLTEAPERPPCSRLESD